MTDTWAAEIERVGPHGYIHGWIHVGIPTAGAKVYHPSHGHGRVSTHNSEYMSVHFDSGHRKQFRVGHPVSLKTERHGWSPGPNDTHINIEAAGTGGTSMGAFRRVKPAATLSREGDTYHVRSAATHEPLGEVRPSNTPGRWVGNTVYEPTGETERVYHGGDFMAAVTAVLGKPPYGHSWYRVARPPGDTVKSRPARRTETGMADPGVAAQRASDLKYGHGSALWAYWTRGAGFAKWSGAAHKWTTLHALLLKAGVPAHSVDGLTTNIITAVMPGYMKQSHAKKAGRSEVETTQRADPKKPYGNVAYADSKNGKYPLDTEAHIRAAWAYVNMPKNAAMYPLNGVTLSQVKARIRAAMKRIGADVADTASSTASRTDPHTIDGSKWMDPYTMRMMHPEYMRLYPLEDMHIIRSADGGDGRTVEAFAAVFDDPAEIVDHEGHYVEVIERSAFNKVLADASRARGGLPGSVKVLYNHGMTIQGTPSERFSMPIGVPVDIRAEARGLLTRTRYNDTPLAEEILENIRAGSITSQSFTGRIVRSDPVLRRGDRHRPDSAGNLRTVRRTELGLREYGPVLWPAYSGAEILGVRMSTPGALDEGDDLEPGTPQEDEALPPDGEAAADEPQPLEESHSQRYHQHALYVLRSSKLREEAGLVW